jgi:DNA-binding CsgD family transcriptional regulator
MGHGDVVSKPRRQRIALRDIRMGEPITPEDWLGETEQGLLAALVTHTRYKELALAVGANYETVKTQIGRILMKTGTHDCAELLIWAIQNGIVSVKTKG